MNFDIIYELIQRVRQMMEKLLVPEKIRINLGKIRVLSKFWAEKSRQIIGGRVFEGEVKKSSLIEVFRKDELLGKGKLINLQRNKKDIDKAVKGEECGMLYEGDVKIEEGDILQIYIEEKKKEKLEHVQAHPTG